MAIHKIAVLGGGQMGAGIAEAAASRGIQVTLVKATPGPSDKARAGIEKGLARLAEKGKITAEDAKATLGRIAFTDKLEAAADADLLIESTRDVLNIDTIALGGRILVDALDRPVQESLALLSACGLGEAQLLLRTPGELSDGQRYRFRLALALARKPAWIVADEFPATLDRTLAKVVAYNIRRTADRTGTGFLLATTHEDILDDLQPSLLRT